MSLGPLRLFCVIVAVAASLTAADRAPAVGQEVTGAVSGAKSGTASAVDLSAALKEASGLPRLRSLLVEQHGELILEKYFHGARAEMPADVKSVSKSVISALTGIAIDRKLLRDVHQPIAAFFPELASASADPKKRAITIEDLLTMRSGLESTSRGNYGAWVRSPDWVHFILSRRLVAAPGEDMEYSTGNTHLLSAILTKVSGSDTWKFAQDNLAMPLGFKLARWFRDPQGIYFGGNEMLLTSRQMLTIGELYLHHGRAGDRQVVPAAWVEASFVPRTESHISGQKYGYGWWISEMAGHAVDFAWGFGGQYIFIVRDLDLVVVTTSSPNVGEDRREHREALKDLVDRLVVAAIASRN